MVLPQPVCGLPSQTGKRGLSKTVVIGRHQKEGEVLFLRVILKRWRRIHLASCNALLLFFL